MKRVWITGVAGFLGSHLADALIKEGKTVCGNDNLIGGYEDNLHPNITFYNIDCNSTEALAAAMRWKEVDTVYHCAATAYEGLSVFSPAFITNNTFQITSSTLSASIQAGVKKFVFLSSMARYGKGRKGPFREYMQCSPVDPYGIAKYSSEQLVRCLCETHGIRWGIAVPHNIIGPRQKYDDPYRNVASIMINRMMQGKQPIIYGDGNQRRCFSFVDDAVSPLLLMGNGFDSEVINIGPDEEPVTINYLASTIADILGFNLDPIYIPDRPREVKVALCSSDKARRLLGYKTTTTLHDGLCAMIRWIEERGPKEFEYHLPLEIVSPITPRTWTDRLI